MGGRSVDERALERGLSGCWVVGMYTVGVGALFQVLSLLFLQELGRRFGVEEEVVDFFDLVLADLVFAIDSGQDAGWRQQLNCVSRTGIAQSSRVGHRMAQSGLFDLPQS